MDKIRTQVTKYLYDWLEIYFPGQADLFFHLFVVTWIVLTALWLHLLIHRVLLKVTSKLEPLYQGSSWITDLKSNGFFKNLVLIFQSAIIQIQADAWLGSSSAFAKVVETFSDLFMLFFGILTLFSLLNTFQTRMARRDFRLQVPLKGLIQTLKLVLSFLSALIAVALLLGKSPVILLSGLGALSAVLMLIFRDPILGLVAGVQLSLNDMLKPGDWLEMPKYDADGDVVDIGLTTVKVQNWDKTITMIPTYSLISDSFKNWRGMSDAGGRRIKRNILINTASIRFLLQQDIERLNKSPLISKYLHEKTQEIDQVNTDSNADLSCLVNGRRLTNIGVFRTFVAAFLKNHPRIHQGMTLMVRQLEATHQGLPIQIYVFTTTTQWAEYEDIQADIFDFIFAALSEFDLVVHESPIGEDIRFLKSDS